jgi:leucyl/phenylalanyl-tRNA--protein transferase
MVKAYGELHRAGYAHSVETWIDGELAGGLYCVNLGRMVFGESMFAHQTDASKMALCALVAFCRVHHIAMIDCQQNTQHLASLGAAEISREDFCAHLHQTVGLRAPAWHFDALRTYALISAANSDICRGHCDGSNSLADEKPDPPADRQMHLADVHWIFDE